MLRQMISTAKVSMLRRIILMTRVLIGKISEPEDAEQWILKNEDIRVYRILAKKID